MGWALVIMFVILQTLAWFGVQALDRRFHFDQRMDDYHDRSRAEFEDITGTRLPRRRTALPPTFMMWFVCGFFSFWIAFIAAALWFD